MRGLPEAQLHPEIPVVRAWSVGAGRINLQGRTLANFVISLSFSLSLVMVLIARRASYDIAHFHGTSLPLIVSIIPLKLMGKRVVAKVAGARMAIEAGSFAGRYGPLGRLFVHLMKKVDAFVAISREIRGDLVAEGYLPGRIHDISNFIVPGDFFPPPGDEAKPGLKRRLMGSEAPLLVFTGRLVRSKRVDLLLKAFRGVRDSGRECMVAILGDGDHRQPLVALASELGLERHVRFFGNVPNVRDYLQAADMLVFPSEREGMPNSVLEAMACGLPVIAASTGGVPDIVRDGENGLLVEAGQELPLRDAILRLYDDPGLRQRMAAAALRMIQEKFSVEHVVGDYKRLYEKLIEQR
jgi:glycosyltransferase involved in cell wall biosynthesis